MKIGCCGNTEYYAQISKMGYDYIELSGRQLMSLSEYQREDFFKEYDAAQFPCLAINDYCGADVPIVGPDFTIKGARAYAARISEAAARLGAKGLGIGAPMARKLPEGWTFPSGSLISPWLPRRPLATASRIFSARWAWNMLARPGRPRPLLF